MNLQTEKTHLVSEIDKVKEDLQDSMIQLQQCTKSLLSQRSKQTLRNRPQQNNDWENQIQENGRSHLQLNKGIPDSDTLPRDIRSQNNDQENQIQENGRSHLQFNKGIPDLDTLPRDIRSQNNDQIQRKQNMFPPRNTFQKHTQQESFNNYGNRWVQPQPNDERRKSDVVEQELGVGKDDAEDDEPQNPDLLLGVDDKGDHIEYDQKDDQNEQVNQDLKDQDQGENDVAPNGGFRGINDFGDNVDANDDFGDNIANADNVDNGDDDNNVDNGDVNDDIGDNGDDGDDDDNVDNDDNGDIVDNDDNGDNVDNGDNGDNVDNVDNGDNVGNGDDQINDDEERQNDFEGENKGNIGFNNQRDYRDFGNGQDEKQLDEKNEDYHHVYQGVQGEDEQKAQAPVFPVPNQNDALPIENQNQYVDPNRQAPQAQMNPFDRRQDQL